MSSLSLASSSAAGAGASAGAPFAVGDEEPLVALAPPPKRRQLERRATDEAVVGTQQSDTLASANMVSCCFDCGPPRHVSLCVNTGTQRHPRWFCKPCNGARRALDLAAKNTGHLNELKSLKKKDPEAYKAKIRSCRIKTADDPPGTLGLRDNHERAAAFSTYVSNTLSQTATLANVQKRKFMNKGQYIAFLKYKEGRKIPEDQEEAVWQAVLAIPDTLKSRGANGETLIWVDKGHQMQGIRGRTLETSVVRANNLTSQAEVNQAMASLGNTGIGAGVFSGPAFSGLGGEAFRPEAALGGSVGHALSQAALAGASSSIPSSAVVVPEEDFAPFGSSFGQNPEGARALEAIPAKRSAPKRRGCKKGSLTAGPVFDAQQKAREFVKDVLARFDRGPGNLSKQLEKLENADASVVGTQLKDLGKDFADQKKKFTLAASGIHVWTASTMGDLESQLTAAADTLQELAGPFQEALEAATKERQTKQSAKMAAARSAIVQREKVLRPWIQKGTPGILLRWLHKVDAIPSRGNQAPWRTDRVRVDADLGETFDRGILTAWTSKCSGPVAARLQKLGRSFGERLTKDAQRSAQWLQEEAEKPSGQGQVTANLRMPPKGSGRDTLESLHWVPSVWQEQGQTPEAIRTFGAPWLLSSNAGILRSGEAAWQHPGFGHFLVILQGNGWLTGFPIRDAMEMGGHPFNPAEWSLNLIQDHFNAFAGASMRGVAIQEGMVLWVPYGWATMALADHNLSGPFQCIQVPYLNAALALEVPLMKYFIQHNLGICQNTANLWTPDVCKQLVDWLTNLSEQMPQHPEQQGHPAQPPIPLMDARDGDLEDIQEQPQEQHPGQPGNPSGQPTASATGADASAEVIEDGQGDNQERPADREADPEAAAAGAATGASPAAAAEE